MKSFLFLISVFSIFGLILAQTTTIEEECKVYYTLKGGNDGSCCNGGNCRCTDGHITQIILIDSNIKEIPKEITQLKYLSGLGLNNNNIKEIPNEITQLKNLSELLLNGNEIEIIPSSIKEFSDSKLYHLQLSNNKIKEIPNEVFQLKNLISLDLSNNNIKEIPNEITQLKNLSLLSLTDNEINTIPFIEEERKKDCGHQKYFEIYLSNNPYCEENKKQLNLDNNEAMCFDDDVYQGGIKVSCEDFSFITTSSKTSDSTTIKPFFTVCFAVILGLIMLF